MLGNVSQVLELVGSGSTALGSLVPLAIEDLVIAQRRHPRVDGRGDLLLLVEGLNLLFLVVGLNHFFLRHNGNGELQGCYRGFIQPQVKIMPHTALSEYRDPMHLLQMGLP